MEEIIEEWREFKKTGYMVSNLGKVRGKNTVSVAKGGGLCENIGKELKGRSTRKGYLMVQIYSYLNQGHSIHRLVAMCFLPNPENKPQVNHKNGIKTDNHISNLEWVTNEENMEHSVRTGLHLRGEASSQTKLNNEQVLEIRRLFSEGGITKSQLGRDFNVYSSTIGYIIRRKTWAHL